MTTEYKTNQHGIKFYIEQASDFDDAGRQVTGRGWFAGIVRGNDDLGGVWFETREDALRAISDYKVAS